jgi:hypothetical protein
MMTLFPERRRGALPSEVEALAAGTFFSTSLEEGPRLRSGRSRFEC